MAFPTSVNDQITDSISQVNTKVLGDAPAIAMGNLFVATGQALANAAHNATGNQQQSYVTMQASTTQAVSTLYSIDPSSTGKSSQAIDAVNVRVKKAATTPSTMSQTPSAIRSAGLY